MVNCPGWKQEHDKALLEFAKKYRKDWKKVERKIGKMNVKINIPKLKIRFKELTGDHFSLEENFPTNIIF